MEQDFVEKEKTKSRSLVEVLNEKGFDKVYIKGDKTENSDDKDSEFKNVKYNIFKPNEDVYPENVFIVGPTNSGKSTLARNIINLGKFPDAEMLFITQMREASGTQTKLWQDIVNNNKNNLSAFHITTIDSIESLDGLIQKIVSFSKDQFGIQNSDKRLFKTIALFDDISSLCIKSSQYASLCSSGSHHGVASISIFHNTPSRATQCWTNLQAHYKLLITFDSGAEIEKLFKNDFPSHGRLQHPITDLLNKETARKHGHLAIFKRTKQLARLRSQLDNPKEQKVFIPVDVNGELDFDYKTMSVNKKIVSFQSFPFVKVKGKSNFFYLKSYQNPIQEETLTKEESKEGNADVIEKIKDKKKKRKLNDSQTAAKLLERFKRKKRYGIASESSENSESDESEDGESSFSDE
ncbi:TPA_asm: IVa2 [Hydra MELD virus]|nr:TPA_asm: IVa2 [Hydra MELD virus]